MLAGWREGLSLQSPCIATLYNIPWDRWNRKGGNGTGRIRTGRDETGRDGMEQEEMEQEEMGQEGMEWNKK